MFDFIYIYIFHLRIILKASFRKYRKRINLKKIVKTIFTYSLKLFFISLCFKKLF